MNELPQQEILDELNRNVNDLNTFLRLYLPTIMQRPPHYHHMARCVNDCVCTPCDCINQYLTS